MSRKPYPLQWPASWARTARYKRGRPQFKTQFARDRDSVIKQLNMRRGSHVVITSDLPTRADGLPYANARCEDPGVAVWWIDKGHEHALACDRWERVEHNLRAIEMSLHALRGLDRWGATEMVEKAFAGFAALPAGSGEEINIAAPKKTWRDVLGVSPSQNLTPDIELRVARANHRALIRAAHPDAGGSHEVAALINAALAEAEKELTSSSREARA